MTFRIEKDLLGEKRIPEGVRWGIHTQRALENFSITDYKAPFSLIKAYAMVKKAACLANFELGYIKKEKAQAILQACQEIIEGKLSKEFPLDALQGGAGTSLNMNINEVIANLAIEILEGKKGNYSVVNPLEDVNLHQSTNDTYPTALKIAGIYKLRELEKAIELLQGSFQRKEKEFADIVKIGRTELQEAVPITLGTEFSGFSEAIARDRWRVFKCEERLRVVNLGGTAIGTGLCAPTNYIFLVIEKLREITGLGLARAENMVGETSHADPFVEVSGILKAHACNLIKICNDLRLLNFLGEINLPQLQTGSSIMPGKVNPVMLEAGIQVGIKVIANDFIVNECVNRATFQINEFLPLLAFSFLESLEILISINKLLSEYVEKITPNPQKCKEYFDKSLTLMTAFLPYLGYGKVSHLTKEYLKSEYSKTQDVRGFLEEKLGKELVDKVLSPYNLTRLGYRYYEKDS